MSVVDNLDFSKMAWHVLHTSFAGLRTVSLDLEDAHAEAMLAGWKASRLWQSHGTGLLSTYVFAAMENSVNSWIRVQLGRTGGKAKFRFTVPLDVLLTEDGERSVDQVAGIVDWIYEDEMARWADVDELRSIIAVAPLDPQERDWLSACAAGELQAEIAARWGRDPTRVSQVKKSACQKLRRCATEFANAGR